MRLFEIQRDKERIQNFLNFQRSFSFKKRRKSFTRWKWRVNFKRLAEWISCRMNLLYLALSPFAHPAKLFSSSIFEAKELFKGTISVHFWILPLTSFRLENERRSAYIFPHLLYSFLSLPLFLLPSRFFRGDLSSRINKLVE